MAGVTLLGVLAAMWISGKVQMNFLLIFYGLVVIGIGVKKLFFPAKRQTSKAIQNTALAIAGIMQGLFVSGGSFLAVYAVDRMPDKREFRATTNALWAMGSGLLSAVLCIGIQPLLELIFNVATNSRLIELSNPNQPLLRRLLCRMKYP